MRHANRFRPFATTAALLALAMVVGCNKGDGLAREAVEGTVTLDGKPIATGLVTFLPDSPEASTQGGGAISGGKYSIPAEQGLVPGAYKIVISAGDDTPEKQVDNNEAPGMPPIPAKEAIPSDYNTKSLLKAEVRAGGPNKFDFSLSRRAAK